MEGVSSPPAAHTGAMPCRSPFLSFASGMADSKHMSIAGMSSGNDMGGTAPPPPLMPSSVLALVRKKTGE